MGKASSKKTFKSMGVRKRAFDISATFDVPSNPRTENYIKRLAKFITEQKNEHQTTSR